MQRRSYLQSYCMHEHKASLQLLSEEKGFLQISKDATAVGHMGKLRICVPDLVLMVCTGPAGVRSPNHRC
jgi:hypothetical protein